MSAPLDGLHAVAGRAAELVGTALVHGTVLAVVSAVLLATVLRRARPAVHAAVWTVVLVKFLVPIGPGSQYSVAALLERLRDEPPAAVVTEPAPAEVAPAVRPAAPTPPRHPLALAGLAAWLVVASGLGLRQAARYRRARRIARGYPVAPAAVRAALAQLQARLGGGAVDARVAPVVAPYVLGALRPILVVPLALVDHPERLGAALAHELAHVRRADGVVRALQLVAATVWFFWPVVRLVNRRLDLAREQACDAVAVAHGPLDQHAYARMLVTLARQRTPQAALALGGSQLAGRVRALGRPARGGTGVVGAGAVLAFAVVGLAGAPSAQAAEHPVAGRVCIFTPALAAEILVSHPDADVDGDGALSRAEVCDYQLAIRRRFVAASFPAVSADVTARDRLASTLPMRAVSDAFVDQASPLASDQLCCNCSPPSGPTAEFNPATATCTRGVDP
ncbi:MAG: M56 family metallopeptidase [Kofleriaceae bacterium]